MFSTNPRLILVDSYIGSLMLVLTDFYIGYYLKNLALRDFYIGNYLTKTCFMEFLYWKLINIGLFYAIFIMETLIKSNNGNYQP